MEKCTAFSFSGFTLNLDILTTWLNNQCCLIMCYFPPNKYVHYYEFKFLVKIVRIQCMCLKLYQWFEKVFSELLHVSVLRRCDPNADRH